MVYCSSEIKHLAMDKSSLEEHQCRKIRKNQSLFSVIHNIAHSEKNVREAGWRKKRRLNNIKFYKVCFYEFNFIIYGA